MWLLRRLCKYLSVIFNLLHSDPDLKLVECCPLQPIELQLSKEDIDQLQKDLDEARNLPLPVDEEEDF